MKSEETAMLHIYLGGNIRRHRESLGMSLRKFGDVVGMSISTISSLERAAHTTVTLRTVERLAAAIECHPMWLLERHDGVAYENP